MSNMRDIKTSDDLELLKKIGVEEAGQLKEEYEKLKGDYEEENAKKNNALDVKEKLLAKIQDWKERIEQGKEGKTKNLFKNLDINKGIKVLKQKIKDAERVVKEKSAEIKRYVKNLVNKEKRLKQIRGKVKELIKGHDEEIRFAKRYEKYKHKLQKYGDPEMIQEFEAQMDKIRDKNNKEKDGQGQEENQHTGWMNTRLSEQISKIRGRRVIDGAKTIAVRTGQNIREGAYRTAGATIAMAKFVDTPRRKANEFLKNLQVEVMENYERSNEYNGFGDRSDEIDREATDDDGR